MSQQRSLNKGAFSTTGQVATVVSAQIEAMNFRSNPTMAVSAIFYDESSRIPDSDDGSLETTSEDNTSGAEQQKELKGNSSVP